MKLYSREVADDNMYHWLETLIIIYKTTWNHNLENHNLYLVYEYFKSHTQTQINDFNNVTTAG
jgi:hypothetical protein